MASSSKNYHRQLVDDFNQFQEIIMDNSKNDWFVPNEIKADKSLSGLEDTIVNSSHELAISIINNITKILNDNIKTISMTNKNISEWKKEISIILETVIFENFMEKPYFTFDLEDKLLWIILCYSSHSFADVIKIVLPMIKYKNILMTVDGNGHNCLMHAVVNLHSLIIMLKDNTTKSLLLKPNSRGLTAFDLMMASGIIQSIIHKQIINCSEFINYKKYSFNVLHMAVIHNKLEFIMYVLSNSPDAIKLLEEHDVTGNTPYILALRYSDEPIIRAIILDKAIDETHLSSILHKYDTNPQLFPLYNYFYIILEKKYLSKNFLTRNISHIQNHLRGSNYKNLHTFIKSHNFDIDVLFCVHNPNINTCINLYCDLFVNYKDEFSNLHKLIPNLYEQMLDIENAINSIAKHCPPDLPNIYKAITQNKEYPKLLQKFFKLLCSSNVDSRNKFELVRECIHNKHFTIDFLESKTFQSPQMTYICNHTELLNICIQKFGNQIININSVNLLKLGDNTEQILQLFEKMDLFPPNYFKINNYEHLFNSIMLDSKLANYILNRWDKFIDKTNKIWIEEKLLNLTRICGMELFEVILSFSSRIISPKTINLLDKNNKTIAHTYPFNKFKKFIELRKDFDTSLLWSDENDILYENTSTNNYNFITYLLQMKELPYISYERSFNCYLQNISLLKHKTILNKFIEHPYFDTSFLNSETSSGLPLVIHMALNNMNIFEFVLKKYENHVSLMKSLKNKSVNNKNILQYCVETGTPISPTLLNTNFISIEMLYHKTNTSKSIIDYLFEQNKVIYKEHIISFILNYINDISFLTKKLIQCSQTYTFAHKLIHDGFSQILLDYLVKINNKNLLFVNSNLLSLILENKNNCKAYTYDSLIQLMSVQSPQILSRSFKQLKLLGVNINDLLIKNLHKRTILEDIISENFLENYQLDFVTLCENCNYSNGISLIELLINKNIKYHKYIDINMWKQIFAYKYNNKSMLFRLCEDENTFINLIKTNNFDYELLNRVENNKTLLENLMELKCGKVLSEIINSNKFDKLNISVENLQNFMKHMPELFETLINNNKYNNIITKQVFLDLLFNSLQRSVNIVTTKNYKDNKDNKDNKENKEEKHNETPKLPNKAFATLINSKMFSQDMLAEKFYGRGRTLLEHVSKNQLCFEYMMENKLIPESLLFTKDSNGDILLLHMKYNLKNFGHILNLVKWDHIINENDCGQNMFHHMANDETFNELINHKDFNKQILLKKDLFGKTCVDYIVENKNIENFELLLKTNLLVTDFFESVDCIGTSLLEKILKNLEEIRTFSSSQSVAMYNLINKNQNILKFRDVNGVNNFTQIIKYSPKLLTFLLKSKDFDKTLLNNIDNLGRTTVMLACEYNSYSVEILLSNTNIELLSLKHLMNHKNMGSCLTKLIKHNPQSIRFVLDSKLMNDELLLSRETVHLMDYDISLNLVQLACVFNPDALSFLLSSKYDLTDLIFEIIGKSNNMVNSLKLAIMYQPDCITMLLKSKYCNEDFIAETANLLPAGLLIESYNYQPASCIKLAESKLIKDNPLYLNQYVFDTITDSLNIHVQIKDFSELAKHYPLVKEVDVNCDPNSKNVCNVCVSKSKKVLFDPCHHSACVSCSLKLSKCPICRQVINKRITFDKH